MATWKIVLIIVLSTVAVGCILGIVLAKHQIKRKDPNYKPLLSLKEALLYSGCAVVGTACILLGIFQPFPSRNRDELPMGGMEDGFYQEGMENPDITDMDAFPEGQGRMDEAVNEQNDSFDGSAEQEAGDGSEPEGAADAQPQDETNGEDTPLDNPDEAAA